MKRITNRDAAKEYVRERADLIKIIIEDIGDREWGKEGSNTLVALSPFREETKPSFKVSGNKFKDWGGEQHGGDVFYWVQLWHGLKFEDSIIYVADKCNIDITQFLRDPTPEEVQTSRYRQINRIAAEWMHECLCSNILVCNDYLAKSGFTIDMIRPYLVGYCPSTDALITNVISRIQITENEVYKLEFNRRELFTNAIVYPVHDHSGNVSFFYTKQLGEDKHYTGANKEHPLMDLGIIYGFFLAKQDFRKNGAKLVLVEGQRDAIALKAGAVLGSDLREQQLEALKEHKIKELVFCYDNDNTGWTKSLNLINNPKNFGEILITITSPQTIDADPHDIWKVGGDGAVHEMLGRAAVPLEYYVKHCGLQLVSLTDKQKLLNSLREYLTKVNGIHLSIAISYLAELLNTTKESIGDFVSEIKSANEQLYNLEAERTLVACCMRVSASFNTARAAGIIEESFTMSRYKKLFAACRTAFDKFGEKYTPQVILDEAIIQYADHTLIELVPNILDGNYKYTEQVACELVLDLYKRRKASTQANELIRVSRDLSISFSEIVNNYRKNLINVTSSSRKQARTPRELADELYEEVKYRERLGGKLIIGYDFYALPSINMILGGIQPSHMIVVAGDTGAGKSILVMNIANCLAMTAHVPTLWIGQEMRSVENTMRLASIDSGLGNTKIQTGALSQKEAIAFAKSKERIANACLYSAKPEEGTIEEILAIIDEYRWKYGIKVVIWDYIGMVVQSHEQRGWSREQVLAHASTIIKKRVTEDMGLPAIIVAQMNRDKHAEGKQKIAGAYRILQDADDFIWIETKTKKQIIEDGERNGNRYIRVGKRRGGIDTFVSNATLDVDPRTNTLRISECSTPSQLSKLYSELVA